jgi:hypothetical protein
VRPHAGKLQKRPAQTSLGRRASREHTLNWSAGAPSAQAWDSDWSAGALAGTKADERPLGFAVDLQDLAKEVN